MRALFTQLSFLIGLVIAFDLYSRQPNMPIAALLGLAASCSVYIVMLLGDYAIHRYFEDTSGTHASLTYLETGYHPSKLESSLGREDSIESLGGPDSLAA